MSRSHPWSSPRRNPTTILCDPPNPHERTTGKQHPRLLLHAEKNKIRLHKGETQSSIKTRQSTTLTKYNADLGKGADVVCQSHPSSYVPRNPTTPRCASSHLHEERSRKHHLRPVQQDESKRKRGNMNEYLWRRRVFYVPMMPPVCIAVAEAVMPMDAAICLP